MNRSRRILNGSQETPLCMCSYTYGMGNPEATINTLKSDISKLHKRVEQQGERSDFTHARDESARIKTELDNLVDDLPTDADSAVSKIKDSRFCMMTAEERCGDLAGGEESVERVTGDLTRALEDLKHAEQQL